MRTLNKLFFKNYYEYVFNFFRNSSFIISEYTQSQINEIAHNTSEFMPNTNIKTGIRFGYKNLMSSIQYSYLSSWFSDARNAKGGVLGGVAGKILAYNILDLSASYKYKFMKLVTVVNNFLNNSYFTKKAIIYIDPRIITS
jgi:Fe(3+) dicitrate transport protein